MLKTLRAEVSLRDVEPVKGFIGSVIEIRNRLGSISDESPCCHLLATTIKADLDAAFRAIEGGFGRYPDAASDEIKTRRGWKIAKALVPRFGGADWPSVCIVIPVYNSPDLLKRCLNTLMKTLYPGKVFCGCVDNASTDPETLAILAAQDFTPLRFEEPQGFATAVNAGIKACSGFDYYVLFNQDCQIIDEDWLIHLISWMEVRPECAIAGPKLLYPDGTIQHAGMTVPRGSCGKHPHLTAPADTPEVNFYEKVQAVTGAVYCIRASILDEAGYLDEGYRLGCEDTEFCLRAPAKLGKEVWYVPDSVVRHIDNGVRKSNPQDSARIRMWAESCDIKFRREWGPFVDLCDGGRAAFVLPDYNPVAGGCRVVGALANAFITAGLESAIYVTEGKRFPQDADFPMLFDIKPISELDSADVLIATRFDTVEATRHIPADRRFYLVQQIETCMAKYCGATEGDVIRSYGHTEYEIVTIGEHLARQLEEFGRSSTILDVGFYRNLYPHRKRQWAGGRPFKALMYASPADYKGGGDCSPIADAIRANLGRHVEVNSFHRDFEQPGWADKHFRPKSTGELASIYANHDVYVYASHSDGFAMTPVEAMACGTPVVLTDFPGKDQYAVDGENCLIVPFRDFRAVADVTVKLMTDPALWLQLSEAGLRVADRYDWSRIAAQYIKLMLGAPI